MDLVRRWLDGWRLCRGLDPVTEYDDAYLAVLRLPGREREWFARTDNPATVDRLAADLPVGTWLTVTTHDGDRVARQLGAAGGQLLDERRTLMAIDVHEHPQPGTGAYRVERTTEGRLEYVRLLTAEGDVAAHGMMGIAGADAVMHDIQTDPAHRRRGLGSVVMGALAQRAIERGSRTGLLMATTDGFHLYRKLGWSSEATMVTASGTAESGAAGSGAVGGDLGAVLAGG
ncbi:GNAT family N-acetyltransferase [Kribbella shirazensis]|uniref:GNAT superfamily N-acetyltransferase n=1 Tax=Kribbella shirazensis TaxID=1105143 RepID=A0A7X5V4W8_9ACTN|nr:GNAT family N-acetyltransferase [Kribbella shirazensis]NIK54685.1 GNAT superfamily N-acetyltransferase [Kribbella shirazensis]